MINEDIDSHIPLLKKQEDIGYQPICNNCMKNLEIEDGKIYQSYGNEDNIEKEIKICKCNFCSIFFCYITNCLCPFCCKLCCC
tara:strand:- start:2849 stop:3097 length:249 start_codon:yes stop_codon:yes gene_type:complete